MEVVSMIAIHEIRRNAYISIIIAAICIFVGLQYIGDADTRVMGIISFVIGSLMAMASVYKLITPMMILGDDSIYFQSSLTAKKEIPYSEIETWTFQGDKNKHLIFQLKSSKEATEEEKKKNTITINYLNMDKNNRKILIDILAKRGIEQIITVAPKKNK
jgi:hypothetical protein